MSTHPNDLVSWWVAYNSGSFGVTPRSGAYWYPEYTTSGCPSYIYAPVQYARFSIGNKVNMLRMNAYGDTDGVYRWYVIDGANSPAGDAVTQSRTLQSCYDGRYIYCIYYYVASNYELRFAQFDCQTDTWIQKDITIISQSGAFPTRVHGSYGSIDRDSNGKLYANYGLYSSKGYHRLNWAYSTNSGSTWTNAQTMPSSPGSKDSEVPYNLFCVGENVYHFYTWGTLPYYQKCMCYNGSGWSGESTFQGSIAAAYHFSGKPVVWSTSGSEIMTIVCTAVENRVAYSFDTVSGSAPNWTNKLQVTNDHIDNTWYYTDILASYNDMPYFVYPQYYTFSDYVFYFGEVWRSVLGRARTDYTTWTPAPTGGPTTAGSG